MKRKNLWQGEVLYHYCSALLFVLFCIVVRQWTVFGVRKTNDPFWRKKKGANSAAAAWCWKMPSLVQILQGGLFWQKTMGELKKWRTCTLPTYFVIGTSDSECKFQVWNVLHNVEIQEFFCHMEYVV